MMQIKSQILSGALKEGDALPSIRVLARGIAYQRYYNKASLRRTGTCRAASFGSRERVLLWLPLIRSFCGKKKMRQLEDLLQKAVNLSQEHGISLEELTQILTLIYQEER